MRYLINKSTDPYFNLALDDFALKHIDLEEDFFFLWQNEPSVIVGKNQNTFEEINQRFIDTNNIKVARRVSGGGAVYHDLGNLNFTFIINVDEPGKVNVKKYVRPIIDALKDIGVDAEVSSRNDILFNGMKISGNAQRMSKRKLMYHGTLLYDVKMENLSQALHVTEDKYVSNSVKSVRTKVTNIKEHLPNPTDILGFRNTLHFFLSDKGKDKEIVLSEKETAKIQFDAINRFSTWEWIYGQSPPFNVLSKKRYIEGSLELRVFVDHGHIQSVRFEGDYAGMADASIIEVKLKNTRFYRSDVNQRLSDLDLSQIFGSVTKADILSLMFD